MLSKAKYTYASLFIVFIEDFRVSNHNSARCRKKKNILSSLAINLAIN